MKIFIHKPVYAIVICLLISILGIACFSKLSIRQFPALRLASVTVNTLYPGATPEKIQSFVTQPLEQAIGSADGVDYMTANSSQGRSNIIVTLKMNYDADKALTDISSKVNAIQYLLPKGVETPSIKKQTGITFPAFIISFTSTTMSAQQISAYLANVVKPQLQNISGIAFINIFGNKPYAMRVWLNPVKMLAYNISAQDVYQALASNNIVSSAGSLKNGMINNPVNVSTNIDTLKQFQNMVIRRNHNNKIRLNDVARVQLGVEDYNSGLIFDGKEAVNLAFILQPGANPITVIQQVKDELPIVDKALPSGLHEQTVYDSTRYIKQSLVEVVKTLAETILIVVFIVFIFLGSFRLAIIPAVAIPLSLVGVCIFLYALGFSINTLTLLAMVLAIGLVVDDAIVVLENIHRLSESSTNILEASIRGAKQVVVPVIVMSLTLAAVFAPLGFAGGITGALFKEFALTLALAVVVSGLVAIILTPMLSSKVLKHVDLSSKLYLKVRDSITKIQAIYLKWLRFAMHKRSHVLILAVIVLLSCFYFFMVTPKALAPQEDQSYLGVAATAPTNASIQYLKENDRYLEHIYHSLAGARKYFIVNSGDMPASISSGVILTNPNLRADSQMTLARLLQAKLSQLPGLQAFVYQIPSLPTVGGGPPVQYILTSTMNHKKLYVLAQDMVARAQASGLFSFIMPNLHFDNNQLNININRTMASALGISMSQINQALSVDWSNHYINSFSYHGHSYRVIPQMSQAFMEKNNSISWVYLRDRTGQLVPLSNLATISHQAEPAVLPQFQQLNSVTLQGIPAKGVSLGQCLEYLNHLSTQILPEQVSHNYAGESRTFENTSHTLEWLVLFSIIMIYLLLALQFESFLLPMVVLTSVPMSLFGALFILYCGVATINIYTDIGLLTLIGLISKHGILLVDCALAQLRNTGDVLQAVVESAKLRLRPILMTTVAILFGVIPLILSHGAGHHSRFDLGIVIFFGMLVGTLFTLVIVPVVLFTCLNFQAKSRVIEQYV